MNSRSGFIGAIIAAIIGGASMAVGAAVHQGVMSGSGVLLVDDPTDTKQAASLQLKSLIPISLTPKPTVPAVGTFTQCGYDGNGAGLEGVSFDEPEVLVDYAPKAPNVAGPTGIIQLWAGDENSIVMGISKLNGVAYPVSETSTITSVTNPQVGVPYEPDGKDNAGRPMFPAIFLTDITDNPANRSGDWQQGGTPIPPHFISGLWISAEKNGSSVQSLNLPPTKNVVNTVWHLAPGGQPPAPGKSYEDKTYYGTEIRWHVADLLTAGKVQAGRTYRAQFMVHDGDSTSDVAQGCVTIQL